MDLPASCGSRRSGPAGLEPATRCHSKHQVLRSPTGHARTGMRERRNGCVVVSGTRFERVCFFLACTATHVRARTSLFTMGKGSTQEGRVNRISNANNVQQKALNNSTYRRGPRTHTRTHKYPDGDGPRGLYYSFSSEGSQAEGRERAGYLAAFAWIDVRTFPERQSPRSGPGQPNPEEARLGDLP